MIIQNKKFKTQLYKKRYVFPSSIVHMPHLDSNIPSNIYYASIGFKVLRFDRNSSDINTFLTLSNCLWKRMQKQGSKHRSIIYMLSKIFGKNFTVFNVFADRAANFIQSFSLPWIRTIHIHVCLLHNRFVLFVYLIVCLLVCAVIILLLLVCNLSLFLCICDYFCSYRLAFYSVTLL